MSVDKVSEVYFRKDFSKKDQDILRERIHWLCSQARGPKILDIGCSQGIASLLLAREGHLVLGIDRDPEAIDYANSLLEQEPVDLSSRLSFIHADIFDYQPEDLPFDTVLLGEILEHLTNPEELLLLAKKWLKPEGRIVITTPFAIHPDEDHKVTFTLNSFQDLVSRHLALNDLFVKNKYICSVAVNTKFQKGSFPSAELLEKTEQAMLELQTVYLEQIEGAKHRIKVKEDKLRSLNEKIKELNETRQKLLKEQKDLKQGLENRDKELKDLKTKQKQAQDQIARLESEKKKSKASMEKLQAEQSRLQSRVKRLSETVHQRSAARDRAAHNYYWTKYLLEKKDFSLTHQIGQSLVQAFSKPGLNTLILPFRLSRLVYSGIQKALHPENPVLCSVLINYPDGREDILPLSSSRPEYLKLDGNKINFNVPLKDSCYLSSKKNSDFNQPPQSTLFKVKPETFYALKANASSLSGRVFVWIIEYSDLTRLQHHKMKLSAQEQCLLPFKTLKESSKICLALQLEGKGSLSLDRVGFFYHEQAGEIEQDPVKSKAKKPDFEQFAKAEQDESGLIQAEDKAFELKSDPEGGKTKLSQLKLACIMDEFTSLCFEPECQLLQLTSSAWKEEIQEFNPDLLFVESAWKGKQGSWDRVISHTALQLRELVSYCKEKGIPTLFWNKEDPVHFYTFIKTAKLFDFVFSTDIDSISGYKRILGHNRVYLLHFAAQPKLHNPVEKYSRQNRFCFAGSYYFRYPERQKETEIFTQVLSKLSGLDIYDRQYYNDNPHYKFPEEYKPYIVGHLPSEEIDKAYKGYKYGVNLNSINQSQSMFARRVFELMASNTLVVSNYSRGLRNLFKELVVSTSDPVNLENSLLPLVDDDQYFRKFRLLGLRQVLKENTYTQRLKYIAQNVFNLDFADSDPEVVVLAQAEDREELKALMDSYARQEYEHKSMIVVLNPSFDVQSLPLEKGVQIFTKGMAEDLKIGSHIQDGLIACFVPEDYYGPNYLTDLCLAFKYADAHVMGKAKKYAVTARELCPPEEDLAYSFVKSLAQRASVARCEYVQDLTLDSFLSRARDYEFQEGKFFSIDEFNYCQGHGADICQEVNDLGITPLDDKMLKKMYKIAEDVPPAKQWDEGIKVTGKKLYEQLLIPKDSMTVLDTEQDALTVQSFLSEEAQHKYIYSAEGFDPSTVSGQDRELKIFVDAEGTLLLHFAVIFYDQAGKKIDSALTTPNHNFSTVVPEGAVSVQSAIRVAGPGEAKVNQVLFGQRKLKGDLTVSRSDTLLIINNYPSYDDLYRNMFVHRRLKEYERHGLEVDVFCFNSHKDRVFYEYQNVDVMVGYKNRLTSVLASGQYKRVLVHGLNEFIWDVLKQFVHKLKIFAWVHGAEIHHWHRRAFNYLSEEQQDKEQRRSNRRVKFWQSLFADLHSNLHFIFVSKYFANEVMHDYEVSLPEGAYSVIHNFIDTDLFKYQEKTKEQRKKVLSIRSYASRKYANDLAVNAVLELSKRSFFQELEFYFLGDGPLFEETVKPLQGFENVKISQSFLRQEEIAELQKEYGVLLIPTRWDSQGVSKDEAMSSGLVPVTNAVAGVTEFVDQDCAVLAEAEDYVGLADGIERLYQDPELYLRLSKNAAQRVRNQCVRENTIRRELELIAT